MEFVPAPSSEPTGACLHPPLPLATEMSGETQRSQDSLDGLTLQLWDLA